MILFPNCKINLGLSITGRRADGYHELLTAMVPVPWCDVLELIPNGEGRDRLYVTGNAVDCPPEKNLVMKAAAALRKEVPTLPGTDIHLHKIIPDGAGLGGGSSDAAFTLRGLNQIYGLGLADTVMAEIAGRIGADCPLFIYNRPMLASGIGTDLTPIDIPELSGLYIAIVKPAGSVSTKEAYAGLGALDGTDAFTPTILSGTADDWQAHLRNKFEETVFAALPQCGAIKERLLAMPWTVYCAMSGSGSAIFALSRREYDADELRSMFADCTIFTGRLTTK